jgi:CheY-like chemotaxis protein
LAITRSVVEQMGGQIYVESKIGKGSTFSVVLPLHAETQQNHQELPFPSPVICVVLFTERLSSFVEETLSARGFSVQVCSTPECAQQALQAGGLQVVIIDIEDPDAKTWVALAHQCKAKVLGFGAMGRGEYGKKLGIEQIVMKPIGTRRLLQRVEELVGVQSIPSPSPMGTLPYQRPYQILLVEDNPDNQSLALHTLRRAGYEVETANDGRAAIEAMDGRSYALVLMDIEMPNMDGLEATRYIRSREREQRRLRTPIVALTAHAMEGFRQRCIEVGMDGYATKPLSRQHLTNIAFTWIDRRPLILIVDDAPDGRELLRRYLEKDGRFRSICVADGAQALRYMEHDRIDAVILDMEMPVMGGCTVATRIRRMPYGQIIPILALTGHTGDDWRQRCMQAGCSEFMSKPLKRSTLIATLSHHLSSALPPGDSDATQPSST